MERNEHDIFDELVRGKLTNYSEPPEPEWIHSIQAKKTRAVNLYHLYKLMLIAVIVGAGMFAGIQLMPFQLDKTAATQTEQSGGQAPTIDLQTNTQPATAEFASATVVTSTNNVTPVSISNTNHSTPPIHKQGTAPTNRKKATAPQHKTSSGKKHTQPNEAEPASVKSENAPLLPTENNDKESAKPTTEKPEASVIPCKAAFDYYTSYSGEFNFVHTAHIADNADITWSFGDGETSENENTKHVYRHSGTYEVTLTITDAKDACSYSKTIVYRNPDEKTTPITISGKLVAGSTLLKNGIVELYAFDENKGQFKSAQNIRTNQSGEYTILLQRNKRYLLKGYPTVDVQHYVATYWGNSVESENASEILIMPSEKDQLIGFTIDLMKVESPDEFTPVQNPIANNNGNNQQVFLVDGNNNIVGTGSLDDKGNFTISGNVPAGDYTIVNPSNGSTSIKTVAVTNETVSGNIFDNGPKSSSTTDKITVYPNPAGNTVNFGINSTSDESATIIVTDAAGVELSHKQTVFIAGFNQTQHDLSGYPPGIYYVLVFKGNKQVLSNRVVKVDYSK